MAEKAPAFQWYPKDIMGSKRVALMSLAEEGAYRRALDYCWLHETLPANPKELARVIGKNCPVRVAEVVAKMFVLVGNELRHERLDLEREKQKKNREKQVNNGSKGGRPRKTEIENESQFEATENPRVFNGLSESEAKKSSASSSSSAFPSALNTNTLTPAGEVFDLEYFRKQGFSWNIENALAVKLDEYLVYRAGDPWRAPIVSYQSIEEILKALQKHSTAHAIEMLAYTIRKQAKGIIFELPNDGERGSNRNQNNKSELTEEEWV